MTFLESKLSSVSSHDSIDAAKQAMRSFNYRHLPVIDEKKLVGVISDRDIQRADIIAIATDKQQKVKHYMHSPAVTIQDSETIIDAIDKMSAHKINSLVVLTKNEISSIVTSTDMMKLLRYMMLNRENTVQDALDRAGIKKHHIISMLENMDSL